VTEESAELLRREIASLVSFTQGIELSEKHVTVVELNEEAEVCYTFYGFVYICICTTTCAAFEGAKALGCMHTCQECTSAHAVVLWVDVSFKTVPILCASYRKENCPEQCEKCHLVFSQSESRRTVAMSLSKIIVATSLNMPSASQENT
jgi:hypothetical protein